MTRVLGPKPLDKKKFADFGDVIQVTPDTPSIVINEGNTLRYDDLANVDVTTGEGFPKISIFRTKPLPLPILIKTMERHPAGSQAFYPLSDNPYLVVVARPGNLNPQDIQVFLAQSDQGVNYHAGTWHHYSLALHSESDFLVVDRGGPGDNTDEIELSEKDRFVVEFVR